MAPFWKKKLENYSVNFKKPMMLAENTNYFFLAVAQEFAEKLPVVLVKLAIFALIYSAANDFAAEIGGNRINLPTTPNDDDSEESKWKRAYRKVIRFFKKNDRWVTILITSTILIAGYLGDPNLHFKSSDSLHPREKGVDEIDIV